MLKALTIAVAVPVADEAATSRSGPRSRQAADAYWARVDFRYADFYKADLTGASLRRATLAGAQFRETLLHGAVLAEATCHKTNFKLTDLRNADLSGADLTGASFESAKVHGVALAGATSTLPVLRGAAAGRQPRAAYGADQPKRLSPHHEIGVATAPTSRAKMVASNMAGGFNGIAPPSCARGTGLDT